MENLHSNLMNLQADEINWNWNLVEIAGWICNVYYRDLLLVGLDDKRTEGMKHNYILTR